MAAVFSSASAGWTACGGATAAGAPLRTTPKAEVRLRPPFAGPPVGQLQLAGRRPAGAGAGEEEASRCSCRSFSPRSQPGELAWDHRLPPRSSTAARRAARGNESAARSVADDGKRDQAEQASFDADVDAALERRNFMKALNLLQRLIERGAKPSPAACTRTVAGLCKARKPRIALELFQSACSSGVKFGYADFHAAVQSLAKGQQPGLGQVALQLLKDAGYTPNAITYCVLISSLARAASKRGGHPYAQLAYNNWQELQGSGLDLDPTAMRTGLNACVTIGRIEEAEELFLMLRRRSALDARSCNILIKGYAQLGDFRDAEGVLERMRAEKITPDAWTYNTLVAAYVEGGELEGASGVLREATTKGFGEHLAPAFSSIIKGYADEGRATEAAEVLKQMQDAGTRPNSIHFSAVVGALANIGDLNRARDVLDSIEDVLGVQPSAMVYNNYVKGVCMNPVGYVQAREVLRDMQEHQVAPNTDTFNMLMDACCSSEEPSGTVYLFREMREAEGLEPDNLTYNTLMKAHIMLGDFYEALDAFEEMETQRNGLFPDMQACNMLAYALTRMDRVREASAALDKIDELANRVGSPPGPQGYGAVLNGFVLRNSPSDAFAVLQRFRKMGGVPDERMYNSIARMCVRNRDWRRALQVVQAMEARGQEADRDMLVSMIAEIEQRMAAEESSSDPSAYATRQSGLRERNNINAGFERFKFWLGLPNTYYNASGEWDDDAMGEKNGETDTSTAATWEL